LDAAAYANPTPFTVGAYGAVFEAKDLAVGGGFDGFSNERNVVGMYILVSVAGVDDFLAWVVSDDAAHFR
jgi:hypothetical protein